MDISSLRERNTGGTMTVSELNNLIKGLFDSNKLFSSVTVRGEISNFVNHRTGHFYFTLKDENGQIRAVMFRSSAYSVKFAPQDGMKVIVHGSVSVYPQGGSYQIYVTSMQPDGVGALYLAYEQMKEKLNREGLFNQEFKKPIPKYPEKIGVITSPTGAAVRDIINVIGRRYPVATIYLYPSLVQGDGAPENLIKALDYFEKSHLVDTVIIGRGGGSIEDLWGFNSEKLARKIFSCNIPIISAVGHETDFTICDFVSDLRAPTPSAAAELSVPDYRELTLKLDSYSERCAFALKRKIENYELKLSQIKEKEIFKNNDEMFKDRREKLNNALKELCVNFNNVLKNKKHGLSLVCGKLKALNPLSVLARGYSIIEKDGACVSSAKDLKNNDIIEIKFSVGNAKAKIIETKHNAEI